MASNRTNYTSPSYRTGGSSGLSSSSRANSYSFSSCGTAKFSSLLSSSSAFSPSSYLSPSRDQQGAKPGVPKLSRTTAESSSASQGAATAAITAASSAGVCSSSSKFSSSVTGTTGAGRKSTFGSTSALTREKSNTGDGYGGSNKFNSTTNDTSKYPSSTSYLRSPGSSSTVSGPGVSTNCNGNSRNAVTTPGGGGGGSRFDTNISSGNIAKKSEPMPTPGYYSSAPQPNPGTRVSTELKSSGNVTYGAIGSSAIASLRPTVQPRYGLKSTVGIQSSYAAPSTNTYASGTSARTSGTHHRGRTDDPNTQQSKSNENKDALNLSSPVKDVRHVSSEEMDRQLTSKCKESIPAVVPEKALVQMNELMKSSKPYVSSIPRPSTTAYSPFSSALSHFTGSEGDKSRNKSSSTNSNKVYETTIKTQGSSGRESSSESENSSSSSAEAVKNYCGRDEKEELTNETNPSSFSSSSCQGTNYSSNCPNNVVKPSSVALPRPAETQQQAGQHNRRPPADPNKLSQSRSPSKSTIPTLCNRSPSPTTPPQVLKLKRNNANSSSRKSSGDDFAADDGKGQRRISGTSSSSSTSSRSNSSDRSSSVAGSKGHGQEEPSWIKSPEPRRSWWVSKGTSSDSSDNVATILRNPNWSKQSKILASCQQSSMAAAAEPQSLEHPLGDRTSPDGTEIPSKLSSPVDHHDELFIKSGMTNIDDILGGTCTESRNQDPVILPEKVQLSDDDEPIVRDNDSDADDGGASTGTCSSFEEVVIGRIPNQKNCSLQGVLNLGTTLTAQHPCRSESTESLTNSLDKISLPGSSSGMPTPLKLDEATLQIYRDGDFGPYLDLEASINEQPEEFDSFLNSRKNSIVLRGQLPVRVNVIIEKLLTSDGRELRRALFSLKQIFQEDKDLVHEFVENGGLSCLIKVGTEADQNYQNYILRALGQLLLYVDGMYGVMRHNETIQWLYMLVASSFRLVQKTALKLLLVFVDYVETNCLLLVEAISSVDSVRGGPPWTNVMNLLHESDSGDTELLVYAMTLVNKVLNGIPDIDTYYDQVDALEEQGMAKLIQKYMGKQCADLDLLQQLQIYEVVLKHEDGERDIMLQLDESMRQKLMNRKGYIELDGGGKKGRRKSRRHSSNSLNLSPPATPTESGSPVTSSFPHPMIRRLSSAEDSRRDSDEWSSSDVSSTHSASPAPSVTGSVMSSPIILNGFVQENYSNDVGITPGLRKRREQAEYQRSHSREFQGLENLHLSSSTDHLQDSSTHKDSPLIPLGRSPSLKRDVHNVINSPEIKTRPWALPIYPNAVGVKNTETGNGPSKEESDFDLLQQRRENTVKDLTNKLASQSIINPPEEVKAISRIGDLSGIILKAKEGLAKSKSKVDIKPSQSTEPSGPLPSSAPHAIDAKKSDNELQWDYLVSNLNRPLQICDLDFTELRPEDDLDVISPHTISQLCNIMNQGISLGPPPPMPNGFGPPPPPPSGGKFPAPPKNPPAPPAFGVTLKAQPSPNSTETLVSRHNSKKTKKTVKLFWKEVREDPVAVVKAKDIGSIWDELLPIPLDTQKLEHLFESRAKDVIGKKQQDVNKFKEVVVLDPKRSNAINIGMTKLAPPRTIKTAILKMDSTIINREGIEKLLTMLPTDEERAKIQEAQFANPDTPLGNAEQFLLTLASISELTARLKLWAFKLDYENLEKEIGEPLMDLKLGIEGLQTNKTFRGILTTLLCIGNFLNGADAKGFQIDYLAKVPEVKDTVHKHSLLHHLCHTVNEKFPESTDLYSEIGPVTRASRVDFEEVAANLVKMEADCKASWDYLRVIAKHDGPTNMKLKMSEFLADCAERIIVLGIIHRRVMNRYHKFLLWLGVSAHQVPTTKPHYLFKVISEFALEYRTTRERVIQQLQKKANHRERNKTRGKLITEQIVYNTKEDRDDAELRQVLNTSGDTGSELAKGSSLTWTRRSKTPISNNNTVIQNNFQNKAATLSRTGGLGGDGHDEILESLVKTATSTPATRVAPRERKRNSYVERKSLRRTLRHGLTDEERNLLASFMATGHSFAPEPASVK